MNDQDSGWIAECRQLLADLRAPATLAPATILPGVRERIVTSDRYTTLDSPIGTLFVAYNDAGIAAVQRTDDAAAFVQHFRQRFGRAIRPDPSPPTDLLATIRAYLAGDEAELHFDLRTQTPFERDVLLKAREIPRGEVRPYAWIAREIGRPKAVRAVGTALGNNPVPLLIPCHRVLRSDGTIGDYVFGSANKRAVLEAEGVAPAVLEGLGRHGVRFLGDPQGGTFCLPTCGSMHLRAERFLQLHSEREALATGLEPCRNCRPVLCD
jgi:O-6-methylguanine DNA methyltransferase